MSSVTVLTDLAVIWAATTTRKNGWTTSCAAATDVPLLRSHGEFCWSTVQSGLPVSDPSPLALWSQTLYSGKKWCQNNNQAVLKLTEVVYKTPNELFAVSWKKWARWLQESQQHLLGTEMTITAWSNEGCVCSSYKHTSDLYNNQKSAIQTQTEMTDRWNIWKDTCIVFRQVCLTSILTWQNRKLQSCSREV